MDPIEKRARELVEMAASARHYGIDYHEERMIRESDVLAAIISALTPPEGHVVVTRDEDGEIVMVSRQNDDHEVLEVIALTTHAGGKPCEYAPPEGYVLVPVELVTAIEDLALIYEAGGDIDRKLSQVEELLAARPEVPNVND